MRQFYCLKCRVGHRFDKMHLTDGGKTVYRGTDCGHIITIKERSDE